MLSTLLQKLNETVANPGFYRPLTAEEQAELFLTLFAPKPKLFKKPKVIQGIDGHTPIKDIEYLSKEKSESLIAELSQKSEQQLQAIISERLATIQSGKDGSDAVITPELVAHIADQAKAMIVLPDFPTLITMEPEAIRNALELLPEGEKLAQEAVEGLPERLQALEDRPIHAQPGGGGMSQARVLQLIAENASTGENTPTFESVSKNLQAFPFALNYTGENLTTIEYTTNLGTVTKTFAYTGENLTSITLSGNLPTGLTETVKTLSYSGEDLIGVVYS